MDMARRWFYAGSTGLAAALLVAAAAWLLSPVAPGLSAIVFGLCALPACGALGWLFWVAPVTIPKQGPSEGDVESTWLSAALSGTATDLIIVIGLGLAAVSIGRIDVPAATLLIGLLLVALASCTTRYAIERRRTLA
ncbi:hypothetical protein CH299_09895 [Rhodococcus sp. 14-2686-1-2]|jgi:hypothetical protein|nr:hypothetical protein CH301_09345 [Rhodococcus sp. 15-1189-1-1a]OZF17397.1 hypothetical protein CH299_09895 [Rhodococcus sp. 14-2686-1-2]